MFGHFPELVIILVLALIVFGPEKLPEMAAQVGKFVREAREIMDTTLNPADVEVPEDFSAYYYESLEHSGEEVPELDGEDRLEEVEVNGHEPGDSLPKSNHASYATTEDEGPESTTHRDPVTG